MSLAGGANYTSYQNAKDTPQFMFSADVVAWKTFYYWAGSNDLLKNLEAIPRTYALPL